MYPPYQQESIQWTSAHRGAHSFPRRSWLWRRRIYLVCGFVFIALWQAHSFIHSDSRVDFPSLQSQYTAPQLNRRHGQLHRHLQPSTSFAFQADTVPEFPQIQPQEILSEPEPAPESLPELESVSEQDGSDKAVAASAEAAAAYVASQLVDEAVPVETVSPPTKEAEVSPSSPSVHPSDISTTYSFPPYSEWLALDEKADTLPDVVHIPFEDAVADEVLEGWEEDWFAHGKYDVDRFGTLPEPKIDFVYTWVNGSEEAFARTMRPYEENSTLNDPEGEWLKSHGTNRYRDWDELRHSIRSVEKFAGSFRNRIQLLVNAVDKTDDPAVRGFTKQRPLWLKDDPETREVVQVLSQEEFFGEEERGCLPSFNSLTVESQLHNTPSDVDRLFAMSDDMLLGRPHSASDIYSPLFGPTLGFKSNGYNTLSPPGELDARRFGEKPYLIYTSWMLNRRFGARKRKGQVHFGHSMSRSVAREVARAFPRPSLKSACQRFRGETGFQLYTWYAAFHYTIERHREALLYSYLVFRADTNQDGNLAWPERQAIMRDLEQGMEQEGHGTFRKRMFYHVAQHLTTAGLQPPKVNIDTLWTSLDGPNAIRDLECYEFDVNECLAPGFSSPAADARHTSPVFSTAAIFDRVARQDVKCGDCLLKLLLNRQRAGLNSLLPTLKHMPDQRQIILKALKRYQYAIVEPDALFMMITDAEQVESTLVNRLLKGVEGGKREVGQLCLNDDVATDDTKELKRLKRTMGALFKGLLPDPSPFER